MKAFFLGLLLVIATIIISLKYDEMKRMKNRELVKNYPKAIEEHLESKYGKKFNINPKYFVDYPGGPIPGSVKYAPYEFKVSEIGEDEYLFYVYVYPESIKDDNIKEIRDNYYWKSIKKQTKEYIEEKMKELLPKESKFIFFTTIETLFDDEFTPEIPMEKYFKTAIQKETIQLFVITPPENEVEYGKFTKDNVYPILYDFYLKNYSNIEIQFYHRETETYDDYKNIDIEEFERSVDYSYGDFKKLWSLAGTEYKIQIKIK